MSNFQEGDVVRLVSGGPGMTFCGVKPDRPDVAVCLWFDTAGHVQTENIPIKFLIKIPAPS